MQKLKYELDPYNRLAVKSNALRGMRKVLDGQFKVSKLNTLTYQVKSPIPDQIKAPHQVKLKGGWSLTEGHQLRFTLDRSNRQTFGEQLVLQGEILDVQKNSLLFAVTSKTKDSLKSIYTLELSGAWQADQHNRLTFRVNKAGGKFDTLLFDGAWQINKNYQIVYSYQKEQLIRKNKKIRSLAFKGHWDIGDKARLSYVLAADSNSKFNFDTGIGIFRDNYIKYELGIGLSRRKHPVKRAVIFSGKWKLDRNIGLIFEVRKEAKKVQAIIFGAEAKLTDKSTVLFNLRNSLNKEIGVELELSRDIFQADGQAFLRLLGSKQESAILAGAGFRW